MLNCTGFVERLYDEDCRHAMESGEPAPPEIAAHIASCAECGREWEEAEGDVRSLGGLFIRPAPAALERHLRLRLVEALPAVRQNWPQRAALWCAVGATVALTAARTLPSGLVDVGPLVFALAGASIAFVAGTLRDALS